MTDSSDKTRRRLILGLPLSGIATLAAASGAKAREAEADEPPVDPRQPRFRETDHVATYYRLNRE